MKSARKPKSKELPIAIYSQIADERVYELMPYILSKRAKGRNNIHNIHNNHYYNLICEALAFNSPNGLNQLDIIDVLVILLVQVREHKNKFSESPLIQYLEKLRLENFRTNDGISLLDLVKYRNDTILIEFITKCLHSHNNTCPLWVRHNRADTRPMMIETDLKTLYPNISTNNNNNNNNVNDKEGNNLQRPEKIIKTNAFDLYAASTIPVNHVYHDLTHDETLSFSKCFDIHKLFLPSETHAYHVIEMLNQLKAKGIMFTIENPSTYGPVSHLYLQPLTDHFSSAVLITKFHSYFPLIHQADEHTGLSMHSFDWDSTSPGIQFIKQWLHEHNFGHESQNNNNNNLGFKYSF